MTHTEGFNVRVSLAVEMWMDRFGHPLSSEWKAELVDSGAFERDDKGRIRLTPLGLRYNRMLLETRGQ